MDKLINDYNRGFSLKNDDLRFIDNSVRLAIADTIKSMCGDAPCIIWGCSMVLEGDTYSVSEGAIFNESEIWHVPAHEFQVVIPLPEPPSWACVTAYDPAGAKLDKDLATHNTYQLRTAVGFMPGLGSPTGTLYTVGFDEIALIKDLLLGNSSTSGVNVYYSNNETEGTVGIKKSSGIVTMRGTLKRTCGGSDYIHLFTIPLGWRCGEKLAGFLYGERTEDGAIKIIEYYITEDGKFYCVPRSGEFATEASANIFVNITYSIT